MLLEQVMIVSSGPLQKRLFLFNSLSLSLSIFLSAVQPHSHSSSLSSVELVSASDDIHRFSAQVLYFGQQRGPLYLQGDAHAYCFPPQAEHEQRA